MTVTVERMSDSTKIRDAKQRKRTGKKKVRKTKLVDRQSLEKLSFLTSHIILFLV